MIISVLQKQRTSNDTERTRCGAGKLEVGGHGARARGSTARGASAGTGSFSDLDTIVGGRLDGRGSASRHGCSDDGGGGRGGGAA